MVERHWTAEETRDGWGLRYNPTPGGRKNEDGSTSYGLTFIALELTDMVDEPEAVAASLAAELNAHDKLVAALKEAQAALAMMIAPEAIRTTTVSHAYAAAVSAEAGARSALASIEEEGRRG